MKYYEVLSVPRFRKVQWTLIPALRIVRGLGGGLVQASR